MFYINLLTTTVCCFLIIAAIAKYRRNSGEPYLFVKPAIFISEKKRDKCILLGAIALLMIIRLIAFGEIPGGYNCDTVMAAVEAKSLAECGIDLAGVRYPVLFEAYGYGQMNVLMSYIMIPFIRWGGYEPCYCNTSCLGI